MRPLSLHASALNHEEYDLYTTSLADLAWTEDIQDNDSRSHDDAYYEQMRVSVREMRGWLRGKYTQLPPGSIDVILRFFSSNLSQTDTLTGGQFFAALRLVVHVENGKEIDRGLAFVQAHPSEKPPTNSVEAKPPSPVPWHNPTALLTPASSTRTVDCPPGSSTSNPFSQYQPPSHPSQKSDSVKFPSTAHNPFASRPPNDPQHKVPPLPPRKPPPAPPQHPQIQVPPPKHNSVLIPPSSRTSLSPTRGSSTSASTPTHTPTLPAPHHPPIAPKPTHVTSNLMKQSLQASKAAQTMKRAEEQLEQERVLQVLKSSAVVPGSSSLAGASITRSSIVVGTQVRTIHNRSVSPGKIVLHSQAPMSMTFEKKSTSSVSMSSSSGEERERGRAPPLPRRRNTHTQQQPSPPVSVSSLEQVALAQTAMEPIQPAHKLISPPPPPVRSLTNPFPPVTQNNNPYHRHPLTDSTSPRSYTASPQSSPSHRTVDLPASRPPPTHPDRKQPPFVFSSPFHPGSATSPFATPTPTTTTFVTPETSPTTRVFRSKSLHHPSPPLPPLPVLEPPPKRKRPESVQVLGSSPRTGSEPTYHNSEGRDVFSLRRDEISPTSSPHRRQTSLSISSSSTFTAQPTYSDGAGMSNPNVAAENPLSKLAKSWQPRLEKARYKAEAGLSRRGYVRDPLPRSKSGTRGGQRGEGETEELWGVRGHRYGEEGGEYEPPSVDGLNLDGGAGSDVDEEERAAVVRRGVERDGLKWPVGEADGWRPL